MSIGYPEIAAIRLGYGLSPLMPPPAGPEEVLASAARTGAGPAAITTRRAHEMRLEYQKVVRGMGPGKEKTPEFVELRNGLRELGYLQLQSRLARAAAEPVGFGERLVNFWADHFTVRIDNPAMEAMETAFYDTAIRPKVNGRFADLLFAAITHPAMLTYLDQVNSIGPNSRQAVAQARKGRKVGLNENLARELLELHTVGVNSGYTQKDVRQLAELLTGLTYELKSGENFVPQRSEPGAQSVLGVSYGGGKKASLDDIRAVLDDLAVRPDTADHLSWKLAVHFVSDNPDPDLIKAMSQAWKDTGGDLPSVYRVLVNHPALTAQFRQKARQPFDFIAASLRALGMNRASVMAIESRSFRNMIFRPMTAMGQAWGQPIGPDGWHEEAETWITPQALAARISWAMRMPSRLREKLPDPRLFMNTALGATVSEPLAWAVPKSESVTEGIGLVLASADFNRR
ncbi:DUF1800 domain-containing protein [Paracoccus pacificus]|uniref:DUF1800 family protein n=1 Tax=Paracoccus pacificus TaxID=1463598 RepID=A0ABW4RBX7_9RHOB